MQTPIQDKIIDLLAPHMGVIESCHIAGQILSEHRETGKTSFIVKVNPVQEMVINLKVGA